MHFLTLIHQQRTQTIQIQALLKNHNTYFFSGAFFNEKFVCKTKNNVRKAAWVVINAKSDSTTRRFSQGSSVSDFPLNLFKQMIFTISQHHI